MLVLLQQQQQQQQAGQQGRGGGGGGGFGQVFVLKADASGATPLHAAAAGGHTMLALALLRHGCCKMSDVDAQGRSAAKVALDRGFEQCALAMYQASKEEDQARVLRGAGRAGRGMK